MSLSFSMVWDSEMIDSLKKSCMVDTRNMLFLRKNLLQLEILLPRNASQYCTLCISGNPAVKFRAVNITLSLW